MELYLQFGQGTNGPFKTVQVQHKVDELYHHRRGLSYTASGYGSKIPTRYKLKFENRWYRVYCRIFSNIGSLYVIIRGERVGVTEL